MTKEEFDKANQTIRDALDEAVNKMLTGNKLTIIDKIMRVGFENALVSRRNWNEMPQGWQPRATWGSGPWDNEADKYEWVDPATQLPCLIVRNNVGALCGYVGVGPQHAFYGRDYSDCLQGCNDDEACYDHRLGALLNVHGGVTYTAKCNDDLICHTVPEGTTDERWWIGFDCAHAFDLAPAHTSRLLKEKMTSHDEYMRSCGSYKDVAYVQRECERLAAQLKTLEGWNPGSARLEALE